MTNHSSTGANIVNKNTLTAKQNAYTTNRRRCSKESIAFLERVADEYWTVVIKFQISPSRLDTYKRVYEKVLLDLCPWGYQTWKEGR